jgi:CO/xanthine dehydrogenase Mo-binding subunit
LEPDNANGWYDAAKQELHLVVPTQSPMEVAQNTASMLAKSRLGLKRLFLHPFYTVGYGSKDHYDMPYYALVAAAYGDGLPVRLANDRFEQFQTSLKRHEFRMRYTMAVDRTSGKIQTLRANMIANGGGRANFSASVAMWRSRSTICRKAIWLRLPSPHPLSLLARPAATARSSQWRRPR